MPKRVLEYSTKGCNIATQLNSPWSSSRKIVWIIVWRESKYIYKTAFITTSIWIKLRRFYSERKPRCHLNVEVSWLISIWCRFIHCRKWCTFAILVKKPINVEIFYDSFFFRSIVFALCQWKYFVPHKIAYQHVIRKNKHTVFGCRQKYVIVDSVYHAFFHPRCLLSLRSLFSFYFRWFLSCDFIFGIFFLSCCD